MRYILVLLLLSAALNSYSQWVQTGNGITGDAIIGSMILDNGVLYACSYNLNYTGGIFKSTNNGQNWTQIPFNNISVPAFLVKNGYYIAAVGDFANNGVYVSSNGGNNWIQGSLRRNVTCLVSSGNYICAGTTNSHGIYISSDNGYNWSQSSLTDQSLLCLAADSTIIYAGTEGHGVYYSTDHGANWTQTAFNNYSGYSLALSGSKVYVGTIQHGVFMSTNRGTDWNRIYPDYTSIRSIVLDNNNIYLGLNYNGNGGFSVSTNNGLTWYDRNEGFVPSSLGVVSLIKLNNYIFAGTTYSVWRRPVTQVIGVGHAETEIPAAFTLHQNYPNPFNPSTTINFDLPKSSNVKLSVYDVTGTEIETLVNEKLNAGSYETKWNGTKYSSGVYFVRIDAGAFTDTKRMLLIK